MSDDRRSSISESRNSRSFSSSLMGSMKQSVFGKEGSKKFDLPGIKMADKQSFKKQEVCQVCFVGFSKTFRQHHCRICANAVCKYCCASEVNKERCCDVCAYKLNNADEENRKGGLIFELEGAAKMLIQSKNSLQQQNNRFNQQSNNVQQNQRDIKNLEQKISQLQKKVEQMRRDQEMIQQQIAQIAE